MPLQSTQIGVFAHLKMEGVVAQRVLAMDVTKMDYSWVLDGLQNAG